MMSSLQFNLPSDQFIDYPRHALDEVHLFHVAKNPRGTLKTWHTTISSLACSPFSSHTLSYHGALSFPLPRSCSLRARSDNSVNGIPLSLSPSPIPSLSLSLSLSPFLFAIAAVPEPLPTLSPSRPPTPRLLSHHSLAIYSFPYPYYFHITFSCLCPYLCPLNPPQHTKTQRKQKLIK